LNEPDLLPRFNNERGDDEPSMRPAPAETRKHSGSRMPPKELSGYDQILAARAAMRARVDCFPGAEVHKFAAPWPMPASAEQDAEEPPPRRPPRLALAASGLLAVPACALLALAWVGATHSSRPWADPPSVPLARVSLPPREAAAVAPSISDKEFAFATGYGGIVSPAADARLGAKQEGWPAGSAPPSARGKPVLDIEIDEEPAFAAGDRNGSLRKADTDLGASPGSESSDPVPSHAEDGRPPPSVDRAIAATDATPGSGTPDAASDGPDGATPEPPAQLAEGEELPGAMAAAAVPVGEHVGRPAPETTPTGGNDAALGGSAEVAEAGATALGAEQDIATVATAAEAPGLELQAEGPASAPHDDNAADVPPTVADIAASGPGAAAPEPPTAVADAATDLDGPASSLPSSVADTPPRHDNVAPEAPATVAGTPPSRHDDVAPEPMAPAAGVALGSAAPAHPMADADPRTPEPDGARRTDATKVADAGATTKPPVVDHGAPTVASAVADPPGQEPMPAVDAASASRGGDAPEAAATPPVAQPAAPSEPALAAAARAADAPRITGAPPQVATAAAAMPRRPPPDRASSRFRLDAPPPSPSPPRAAAAAARAAVADAPPAVATDSRCRTIVLKAQLGEETTHAERAFLRNGCGARR
jgi:hypothetical protein